MTRKGFHARDKIACTESHKRMAMCFQGVCVSKREGASYALEPKRVEIIKCRLIHNTPLTFSLVQNGADRSTSFGFFPLLRYERREGYVCYPEHVLPTKPKLAPLSRGER